MAETATAGQAANAQKIMVAATRFIQEHSSPAFRSIETMRLPKGHKQAEVPKVGQFIFSDLTDGEDMTEEQSMNMTTTTLTVNEVGAKVILTDKLLAQNGTTDAFRIVGRQAGDGWARKTDEDTIALYPSLNGTTTFGGAGNVFSVANAAATIVKAKGKTEPFEPNYVVGHPHWFFSILNSATVVGGANFNPPEDIQRRQLQNFFQFRLNQVNFLEDGNLEIDSSGDAVGALAQTDALVKLMSKDFGLERERDASRRAWELNWVGRYGCFVLDDQHGAPLTYDASAPNDTA